MSTKDGLFLLEAIIYILLLILLLTISFKAFFQFYKNIQSAQSVADAYISSMVVGDFLARDLQSSASEHTYWKKISRNELIWSCKTFDTGWRKNKNRLERLRGIYDKKSDKWRKISVAPMLDSISDLSFEPKFYKNNSSGYEILLITFTIKLFNNSISIVRSVAPRNRNLR